MRAVFISYGSFCDPNRREQLGIRVDPGDVSPDSILGFYRTHIEVNDGTPDDGIFPIIRLRSGARVNDCQVFSVKLEDLRRLDKFEGPTYARAVVTSGKGRRVTAYVSSIQASVLQDQARAMYRAKRQDEAKRKDLRDR